MHGLVRRTFRWRGDGGFGVLIWERGLKMTTDEDSGEEKKRTEKVGREI